MRKLLFAATAGIFLFASCNNASTGSDDEASKKNLEAHHMIVSAFQTGDVSKIDSAVSEDFLDHTDRGDIRGRDSLKSMITYVHTNFKDMKSTTVKELADKEYVFAWLKYTGTSDGSMGMPSGPYEMNTMEVSRYKDGKAVEHWAFVNAQEMMKMMGQGHTNTADTTAKKQQ